MRLDALEAAAPVFLPLRCRFPPAEARQTLPSLRKHKRFFFLAAAKTLSTCLKWDDAAVCASSGKRADGFRVEKTSVEITRGHEDRGDEFIRAARKQICPGNSKRMSTLNQNSESIQRVLRGNSSISQSITYSAIRTHFAKLIPVTYQAIFRWFIILDFSEGTF